MVSQKRTNKYIKNISVKLNFNINNYKESRYIVKRIAPHVLKKVPIR